MSTAVVTAPIGPGLATTAITINDVRAVNFDFDHKTVTVIAGSPAVNTTFAYATVATVTFAISGGNTTVTIST